MSSTRRLGLFVLIAVPLWFSACASGTGDSAESAAAGSDAVPAHEVDPTWPRDMPNNWIMGAVTSVFVDAQDHVWVTHLRETLTEEETGAVQDPPTRLCCVPAPVVIEFDTDGNVVQGWGDPETQDVSEFPRNPHGLFVDHNDFVWIGTYRHHRLMKFTRTGELVMTIGQYDVTGGSNDPDLLGGPAGIWVDPATNEVYVADGYGNRRVVVYNGDTGAYLRHWGAYGERPDDEYSYGERSPDGALPEQFSTVHGLQGSNDGLIYVADRSGTRVQVFDHAGTFVAEKQVPGSFVVGFSPDAEQQWLYLADGTNHKVWILRRSDLEIVGDFGRGGRQVGQFLRPHGMGVDSQGNVYVGEASTGRRVQKFALQGVGSL
jgi:DNA-binding beta-propeller fold protein YncE